MIISFRDKATAALWGGQSPKSFRAIERQALRRLVELNHATSFRDLQRPGNDLKTLESQDKGLLSIRVNRQYRIRFVWDEEKGEAHEVEIGDFH